MFFVLCEFCKKDADKFKIYRRFSLEQSDKLAPPNLKFSVNLSLVDEIYKVKPRIIFDTARFRSLDL